MIKSFPVCLDSDQFTVRFDYKEEQTAFKSVVSKLHTILKDYEGGKQQIKSSDIFSTTLQKEVGEDTVAIMNSGQLVLVKNIQTQLNISLNVALKNARKISIVKGNQ